MGFKESFLIGNQLPDHFQDAEQVDLNGRCVVPAFGDTHIHFASFAFVTSKIDCRNAAFMRSRMRPGAPLFDLGPIRPNATGVEVNFWHRNF